MVESCKSYKNPYDEQIAFRHSWMDLAPRFYIRNRHLRRFIPHSPQRIIDIGCGDGLFLQLLFDRGFIADGIDASALAIDICKQNLRKYPGRIECCYIEDFQPVVPYDLLICGEVIEHIENDVQFLKNVARIASNNATLLLSTPLDMSLWSKADKEAGHFRRYSKEEILGKIQQAGFTVEKYVIWGYPMVRYLIPYIRRLQDMAKNNQKVKNHTKPDNNCKKYAFKFLSFIKFCFLFDELFNFSENGVDIVIKATKR